MSDDDKIETVLEEVSEDDAPTPQYDENTAVNQPQAIIVTEAQIFPTNGAGDGPQVQKVEPDKQSSDKDVESIQEITDATAAINITEKPEEEDVCMEPSAKMVLTAEKADIIVHMTMDGEKVQPMRDRTEDGLSEHVKKNPLNTDTGALEYDSASGTSLIGYTASERGPDASDITDNEEGAWGLSSAVTAKELPPLPFDKTLKHPIAMAWTLWMFVRNGGSWLNNQVEIATFDTIEDFWTLYSHIKLPGDLDSGCDYAIFREGTKPMWEDVNNAGGGRWIVPFSTSLRNTLLNQCWIHVVIAVLGESFPQTHEVCGVVINIREKRDKIAIWTKCARRDRNNKAIGRYLKDVLNVSSGLFIKYFAHCDAHTPQKFLYCL